MKIRKGSVTVSIIPHAVDANRKSYKYFRVCFNQDGRRHRVIKKTEEEAVQFANDKAMELAGGYTAANQVTPEDAAAIARIRQLMRVAGIDKPPELAMAEYCDTMTSLDPMPKSLEPLAACFKKHNPSQSSRHFGDAVKDFIAAKEKDGTRWRHRKDLSNRLALLAKSFQCSLEELDSPGIVKVLDSLQSEREWTNRTRNHYRMALNNLMSYARANRWVPRDWREMEFVPALQESDGVIGIYTPEEIALFLAHTADAYLPAMVISFFCELRTSEIIGRKKDNVPPLDWRHVNLRTGEVHVSEGKVRTAGHRNAWLPPNARAWLRPHQKAAGPVYNGGEDWFYRARKSIAKKAGLAWKHNGARHSSISYRAAHLKDLAQVSTESGTSESTLIRRYRHPLPKSEARKYLNIWPAKVAKSKITILRTLRPRLARGQKKAKKLPRALPTRARKSASNPHGS